ncbi:hypothetical protein BDW42DRAFT_18673 [Aspergillus taichungensis]|uniref:BTB domain-containing protein n=1 Tax=Aspergillus taichungensis TaxID=482145 RepID=A0A2J5I545_9EURO|nr:hypothetical protein BDW42DRAFT_18673 [Aspergillus taichungensis]
MEQPTHVIDPDGEVIIVLQNTDPQFAELDGNIQGVAEELNHPEEHMETPKPTLEEEPAVTEEPTETGVDAPQEEVCFRIQVSAKHLTFASPVFKNILTGGWKESVTYLQQGSVEITAESWDIDALLILLRIIHCQYHHIPLKLTLEVLAKIAALAEYYNCRETVRFLGHIWISALEEPIPSTDCRDLILWLWISWFFQLPSQFKEATSTAMSWGDNWIDNLGLPISDKVIKSMNDRRQEAITNLVHRLHEKREELLSGSRGCGYECSSIMYGALTKQMQLNALLCPKPEVPFVDLNYRSLVQRVSSFISPHWDCDLSRHTQHWHLCDDSSFERIFGELSDTIEGLDLDGFIHGSTG